MATGQVLIHRFYAKQSLKKYSVKTAARACLLIAAKIEESPRHIRHILNVCYLLDQLTAGKTVAEARPLRLNTAEYVMLKDETISAERKVLKEFGFETYIEHPYKFLLHYLTILRKDKDVDFAQKAWNYLNDSLRLPLCLQFRPETIASACIYITAAAMAVALPLTPVPWYELFEANKADLDEIAYKLIELYKRPIPKYTNLALIEKEKREQKEKEEREKREKERVRERPRSRSRERTDRDRGGRGDRDRDRDADRNRPRDRNRDREPHRDRERDRDRDQDRERDRQRDRERERDKERPPASPPRVREDRLREKLSELKAANRRSPSPRGGPRDEERRRDDSRNAAPSRGSRERPRDRDEAPRNERQETIDRERERERGKGRPSSPGRGEADDADRRRRDREERFKSGPVRRDSPGRYRDAPYRPRE